MVNAVETCAKGRLTEKNDPNPKTTTDIIPEVNDKNLDSSNELDNIMPLVEPEILKQNIVKLSHKEFVEEQKKSSTLKKLFEEAENGISKKTNCIIEDKLKKTHPLKIVPVINEIFMKINIDASRMLCL